MSPLFDKQVVINLGKGGVGKSVVSAAMALAAAKRNMRVLLVELSPRGRLASYLGCERITTQIKEILPNLFAVSITPKAAIREYVLLQIKLEVVYRVVFENRFVSAFLDVIPALSDLVMLGKIEYHANETVNGKPKYDLIVVDSPATGHGLFFLEAPKVMAETAVAGPIKEHAVRMFNLLQNRERTGVNLIAIPEELPVSETIEAYNKLTNSLGIGVDCLFLNRCIKSPLTKTDAETLNEINIGYNMRDPVSVAVHTALAVAEQQRRQEGLKQRLVKEVKSAYTVELPELYCKRFGRLETEEIASVLEEAMCG